MNTLVRFLPQGLPSLLLPRVPVYTYLAMILPAIGIVLVAYSEALGVAREFADISQDGPLGCQEKNPHRDQPERPQDVANRIDRPRRLETSLFKDAEEDASRRYESEPSKPGRKYW